MRKQNVVTVLAPAKLNLALDVVGLLPNGYHDLDMTMQAITLYEREVLRRSPYLNLRLPGSLVAPNNKNTAIKAALAFFHYTGLLAAELTALGITADAWSYYWKYLPNNLYAILAILVAYYVAASGKDIGPMYLAEKRANETGRILGPKDDPIVKDMPGETFAASDHLPVRNFIIPMGTMFIALFASIFYTGKIWENGANVFTNCDVTTSIIIGFSAAGIAAIPARSVSPLWKASSSGSTHLPTAARSC